MTKKSKAKSSRLREAYQTMLERVRERLENLRSLSVHEALQHANAKETAVQLEEVTLEEAETLVDFVQRDVGDAAQFLNDTGENLKRWLRFDINYIEEQLWRTFSRVADKTRVEQLTLNLRLKRGPIYRAGEVTGPGTLQCIQCGQEMSYHQVSDISPCGNCQGTDFARLPAKRRE